MGNRGRGRGGGGGGVSAVSGENGFTSIEEEGQNQGSCSCWRCSGEQGQEVEGHHTLQHCYEGEGGTQSSKVRRDDHHGHHGAQIQIWFLQICNPESFKREIQLGG